MNRAGLRALSVLRHKHFLRGFFRQAVLALPSARRRREAERIARRLARLPAFRRARTVGLYLSLPQEVDTAPVLALCRALGKRAAVPVVSPARRGLRFIAWSPGLRLKPNVYGIPEPEGGAAVSPAALDLLLVPGRAFTPDGRRLGAGGGYYDRFLSRHPRLFTVGLAYSVQVAAKLPSGPHDRRLSAVLAAGPRR